MSMTKNTPSNPLEKARILFEARQYEASKSELTSYLDHQKEDGDGRFLLAECLWRIGRYGDALRQFEKCFNGDKSKRYVPLHVCSLLYHETLAKFFWSDLIYWCLSAVYCGANVDFVKALFANCCNSQMYSIKDQLRDIHREWISDIRTLTADVRKLRLSLSRIRNSMKTKSPNIKSRVKSNLKQDMNCQTNSQIYDNYFNIRSFNYACNTYFDTKIYQTCNNNNECDGNISSHNTYDSTKHVIQGYNINKSCPSKHTKVNSPHGDFLFRSKPIKTYQRQQNRRLQTRKLRNNLLSILKCVENTNCVLLKCEVYTHAKARHYISYILGIKYMNFLPSITKNINPVQRTNIYNPDSYKLSASSRNNVEDAINKFCTDNKVILERLNKKSRFDTKVSICNTLARFFNDNEHILKRLKSRSCLNEIEIASSLKVYSEVKNTATNFAKCISDSSCSKEIIKDVFTPNDVGMNKGTLDIAEVITQHENVTGIHLKSSNAQKIMSHQIYEATNKMLPSSVEELENHELNELEDKSHCDHEIINDNEVRDIAANNSMIKNECDYANSDVILHNNISGITRMISPEDLEYKPTSTEVGTAINCTQFNLEFADFTKISDGVLKPNIFSHDCLNSNNCCFNIDKHDQTTLANTLNNAQYNDCSNIAENLMTKFKNHENIDLIPQCFSDTCSFTAFDVVETNLPYNDISKIVSLNHYSEIQKYDEMDGMNSSGSANLSDAIVLSLDGTIFKEKSVCDGDIIMAFDYGSENLVVCHTFRDILAFNKHFKTPESLKYFEPQKKCVYDTVSNTILPCNDSSNSAYYADLSEAQTRTVTDGVDPSNIVNIDAQNGSVCDGSREINCRFNIHAKNTNQEEYERTESVGCSTDLQRREKSVKILDKILSAKEDPLSFCGISVNENNLLIMPNYASTKNISHTKYHLNDDQVHGELALNTHYTETESTKICEDIPFRSVTPSMYSIGTATLSILHDVIRPYSLIQIFECDLSISKEASNSSCIQDISTRCVKSFNDDIYHTIFDDELSEINWSNESSDAGYDSEVSVDIRNISDTIKNCYSMRNFNEKYFSWSTEKKHFKSEAWSSYFNSIVNKYLYKTYIPHYVNAKIDLTINLSNITIDQSTISLNSFNDVLKIYDTLNNKNVKCKEFICQDKCECDIEHLIYSSFLNSAVPDLHAVSLFCDPSKLLVQNLCRDVFSNPVFNCVLRFGRFIPKRQMFTKVKDNTFLLVNLCFSKTDKK